MAENSEEKPKRWDDYKHRCRIDKKVLKEAEEQEKEGVEYLTCTCCGVTKPKTLKYFASDKRNKRTGGFDSRCRECDKKRMQAQRDRKLARKEKERLYMIEREKTLRKGRENFFNFCQIIAGDFFKANRWHLWLICNTLQALYERHLTKKYFYALCTMPHIPKWLAEDVIDWDRLEDGKVYKKLMLNVSPRAGKSRSVVNFCDWILGKSPNNRIITVSYNTDLAANMSRYVRDGIMTQKTNPFDIVYSDIFPDTKVARGNSGFMKWSLEGQFFNYLGTGLDGTITGIGGNVVIVDDPIKNADEAMNDRILDQIYTWYTSTFLSRAEKQGDGAIELLVHTRWSTKDLCGRILNSKMGKDWIDLKIPVEHNDEIFCEDILPRADFNELAENIDPAIWKANYYQEPMDIEGRLFEGFKTYDELPQLDQIIAYCDTADEGSDYLACIVGGIHDGEGYILDILYTQDPMQETETQTADMLVRNKVNHAKIESNNGGKGFARNVERIIWEKYHTRQVNITWFHQTENKMARILTGASFIEKHVYFPKKWENKFPDFFEHVSTFQKAGKNKHDDGVEALVEWGKMITGDGSINSYMEWMKKMQEGKL